MELNYQRCPEDDSKMLTSSLEVSDGQQIDIGLAEIATTLQIKGSIYSTTAVIKSGVTDDFIDRVAAGLAKQMGEDIHALCPAISIICKAFALMSGGRAVLDKEKLLNVYPSKECPPWMRGLFESIEESKDDN